MTHESFLIYMIVISIALLINVIAVRRNEGTLALTMLIGTTTMSGIAIATLYTLDPVLQWVLIEGSTLTGALLIAFGRKKRLLGIAWKFLLINSSGLGLALLGLVVFAYGAKDFGGLHALESMNFEGKSANLLMEGGIWLAIFGYSAKLGLFPNHFWVGDTYAETPHDIAAFLAALIPPIVALPIRNLIHAELQFGKSAAGATNFFLWMSIATMIYAIWTLWQTTELRRMQSLTAMFHNGALGALLAFDPSDSILYFALTSVMCFKALWLIAPKPGLKTRSWIPFIVLFATAFTFPLSPFLVTDFWLIDFSIHTGRYWIFIIPLLGVVFVGAGLYKLLQLAAHPEQAGLKSFAQLRRGRKLILVLSSALYLLVIYLSIYGWMNWPTGGFRYV